MTASERAARDAAQAYLDRVLQLRTTRLRRVILTELWAASGASGARAQRQANAEQ